MTRKLDYSSIYGDIVEENGELRTTGADRTGCMWCPLGWQYDRERFVRLKRSHPAVWKHLQNLGIETVLNWIRRGMKMRLSNLERLLLESELRRLNEEVERKKEGEKDDAASGRPDAAGLRVADDLHGE